MGLPIVNWLGVWVLGGLPVEWGELPIMPWDLDALMVGVGAHGFVKVKTPFKRPKTRVQVDGFYALCGDVVPLFLLQVRFCRGGGVRGVGVGCRVTLIIFPRRVNLITGVGLVMPQLVLGAVGYWLMTGPVGDEGESGSLVTLSL